MSGAASALFVFTAFFAIVGAMGTVLARRPLRAAVGLLIHIIALAALYLTLHAQLLAALQVLVYAGAVVVLFVFVIMLIGPAAEVTASSKGRTTAAVSIALTSTVLLLITFSVARFSAPWGAVAADFGNVEALGMEIYKQALVPFELISVTLLVAIVGAIAIARGRTDVETERMLEAAGQTETAGS